MVNLIRIHNYLTELERREGTEPLTHLMVRDCTFHLCYSPHLSSKSFFLFREFTFFFFINNVIISVPCETRTHAPRIKSPMLYPAELTEHSF